jgi:predicted ATPase/GAF domain-containing protein/tRNA A-37 threonylcarbamoyl transferase component Bud32
MIEISGVAIDSLVYGGSETDVFRGRRLRDGARIAVKVTHSDYPTFRQLARLRREHAILRELDEPGVPRALELIPHSRGLALVLEDLGPMSLADLIAKRGRLDPMTTLRIAVPLVQTLDALHRKHILHKDIKPRNVMIDEATLEPRLIDFGIAARISQEMQEASKAEWLEGTLAYIAPEQTGRMNRPVDRRSDLYSLGVTLYEMLAGTTPFQVAEATEAVNAHLTREPAPLHTVAVGVPRGLSNVVMKLLVKAPEGRYQGARGLLADLEECRRQLEATRTVAPFPLGRDDLLEEVVVPERLVGREPELAALKAALDRARSGAATLALVTGPSGIGKSALVRELFAAEARGAYLATGRFDETARSVPLSGFSQVIRALVRRALVELPSALEAKKRAIEAVLGQSGRVVTDLCPDMELLIGPQEEAPAVGASEGRNRLLLLIRRLFAVFSKEGAPLCVAFDDLQWADPASLDLLRRLLTDPDTRNLCVIGAYRDDEVDVAHPLAAAVRALREAKAPPIDVALGPLPPSAVEMITAEALHTDVARAAPLAEVVREKTHGSPLFLGQFLRALEDEGVLRFDQEARGFVWDIERVKGAMATDNVLSLMARKVERLSPAARRALMLASCIGPSFDLWTLATIVEKPPAAAAADLWEAVREGLVQPIGGDYRLLDASVDAPDTGDIRVVYRFLHGRVREASYALVPPAGRPAVHLAIGELLMTRSGGQVPDEDLLKVTRHLNLGASAVADEGRRMDYARLDLRAGRRAMAATAFEEAASLFAAGRALASEEGFSRDHEACFALWLEGAEAAYLTGAFEEEEALTAVALTRAKDAAERARVYHLRVRALFTRGQYGESVRAGLRGLAELGVTMPEEQEAQQAAFMAGIEDIDRRLEGRSIASLAGAPAAEDAGDRLISKLMNELTYPLYFVSPSLYGLNTVEQVRRSIAQGVTELSAVSYISYAFIQGPFMGRYAEGHAFGRLAVSLCERFKNLAVTGRVHTFFSNSLYVGEPLRNALEHGTRGRDAALEAGDNVIVAACYGLAPLLIGAGLPIEEVKPEADRCLALARHTQDPFSIVTCLASKQLLACLTGKTQSRTSLDSDDVTFDEELAKLNEKEHAIAFYYKDAYCAFLHVLYGEHEAALEACARASRLAASVQGVYWTTNVLLLEALARAGLARLASDPEARRSHEAAIEPLRAKLSGLAQGCASNYEHKVELVLAEVCALRGDPWEAFGHYEKAVRLARESGYAQDEAIASELCGRFLLSRGRDRTARGYLADALRGYLHWGAAVKADTLRLEFPEVAARSGDRSTHASRSSSTSKASADTFLGRTTMGGLRDASLVLRAAQAIAGEIVLSRVVSRLMRIVLENSGAERGTLLLARGSELFVDATFRASPESIEIEQRRSLEDEPAIAKQAVLYAWRTREPLVLDDAQSDARFASDPYVATRRMRSVLCLPVSSQGRAAGILYLENSAVAGVFTTVRVELLGLLASQASIAIENALLLEGIQAANEEVHKANTRLEQEVEERTRELASSNADLARELADRERAEEERAALREQVLEAQRARLAELMTPMLPISEDVLVMPIIGTMDAERAAQVMQVALTEAQRTRARALILDITGMRSVDADVVNALVGVASALRLLGTEPLFTGIRPEVAQTMVELGVDLGQMTTLSTLRAGIARALSGPRGARR